jgi:septum formation protein
LAVLRAAGVTAEVMVSDVDESVTESVTTQALVCELARRKGEAVLRLVQQQPTERQTIVLACDTMLELGGVPYGKPGNLATALERLAEMRGNSGTLYTGHFVAVITPADVVTTSVQAAATTVHFSDMTDAEIAWYAATEEPLNVAGSFTIDGLGGPFVTGITGDPHNVVGLSLPLLRNMLTDLGICWPAVIGDTRTM